MWFFPLLALVEDVATSGAATRASTDLRTRLGLRLSVGRGPLETVSTWPFRQVRLTQLRIEVGDGVEVLLRHLGEGSFATAYEDVGVPDRVWITLPFGTRQADPGKEIVLQLLEKMDNPYLPYLREVGRTDEVRVFLAPKLRAPLRKDQCTRWAWKEARALQACARRALLDVSGEYWMGRGTKMRERFMVCAESDPVIGASPCLLEALRELHGEAYNHGSNIYFEFPVRNLASDKDGNLVLLDVLYDQDRLR